MTPDTTNATAPIDFTQVPEAPKPRGTAAMSPEMRREVARKGGLAVSKNRKRMAELGRKGGAAVSKDRAHMSAIGRKGGSTPKTLKARSK